MRGRILLVMVENGLVYRRRSRQPSALDVRRCWHMFIGVAAVSRSAVPGVKRIYYRGHLS